MRSAFLDFIVDCSAQANWVGYGRATELLCEFFDSYYRHAASNQDLLDYFERMIPGLDLGPMPERLSASDLIVLCNRQLMKTDEEILEVLCQFIDDNNLSQNAMGFFEDMVEYHRSC